MNDSMLDEWLPKILAKNRGIFLLKFFYFYSKIQVGFLLDCSDYILTTFDERGHIWFHLRE